MFYNGTMNYLSKILIIASIFLGAMVTPFQISIQSEPQHTSEKTALSTQVSFDVSPSIAYAELEGPQNNEGGSYFRCSWYNVPCHLLDFIYILAVPVGNFFVGLAGMVLDFFMLHSISSASYRSGFIEAGWEILRDVTNIVFLFGLLYLAFNMVLGRENSKKGLINIILIALTINFSLFMSYVILDISNVFAHVFYNKIIASEVTREEVSSGFALGETVTTESRALAIADKIDPQKLTQVTETNDSMLLKFIVVLVAGFINYTLVLTFLKVALLMIGRTVGLFVTIVLSPLAFASIIIPKFRSMPYVGFDNWLKDLVKLCFLAPVFLFFLYITVQFINIGLPGSEASEDVFTQLLNVLIPMIAIVVLLNLSKTVATDMAGKIGGMVADTVSKGLKTVGKVALGGAAIAATAGVALTAGAASGTGKILSKVGLGGVGDRLQRTGNVLASTKLDLTRLPGFERLAGRDVTRFTSSITGRSARGNAEAGLRWARTPFSGLANTAEEDAAMRNQRLQEQQTAREDREEYNGGRRFGARTARAQVEGQEAHERWQEESGVTRANRQGERARRKAEEDKARELSEAQSRANAERDRTLSGPQGEVFADTIAQLRTVNREIEGINDKYRDAISERAVDVNAQKTAEDRLRDILKTIGAEPQPPQGQNVTQADKDAYDKEHAEWEQRKKDNAPEITSLESTISDKKKAVNDADKKIEDLRLQRDGGTDASGNKIEGLRDKKKDIENTQKSIAGGYADAMSEVERIKDELENLGSLAEQRARNAYADSISTGETDRPAQNHRTANAIRDGRRPVGGVAEELHRVAEAISNQNPTI
jgi:hypothetical protein